MKIFRVRSLASALSMPIGVYVLLAEAEKEIQLKELEAQQNKDFAHNLLLEANEPCTVAEHANLRNEVETLKAAITTPELYIGIISDVIAEEREKVVAENIKLHTRHAALVDKALAVITQSGIHREKHVDCNCVLCDLWKAAIAEVKP